MKVTGFARDHRGATALEFAMVAGPLLLLALAATEYGRLIWTKEALQMTATEAVRCIGLRAQSCATAGAYDPTKSVNYVTSTAKDWGVALSPSDVSVTTNATAVACSGLAEVQITYAYQVSVPAILPVTGNVVQLASWACFPNER